MRFHGWPNFLLSCLIQARKLEFLLADAISQGYDSVVACGAVQSNQCRATAVAAKQMGLKCHLIMHSNDKVSAVYRLLLADVHRFSKRSFSSNLKTNANNCSSKK